MCDIAMEVYNRIQSEFNSDTIDQPLSQLGLLLDDYDIEDEAMVNAPVETAALLVQRRGVNLGISLCILPHLFKYAQNMFYQFYNELNTAANMSLDGRVEDAVHHMIECTRVTLMINADHATAWNVRRKIVNMTNLFKLKTLHGIEMIAELKFLNFIFSKHPKSGEAWEYRRWICASMRSQMNCDKYDLETMLWNEIDACEKYADLYPKNYLAWTHRAWIDDQLLTADAMESRLLLLLNQSKKWTNLHISDSAGFAHRRRLLQRAAKNALWIDEIQHIQKMVEFYPGHETLWVHFWCCWLRVLPQAYETIDNFVVGLATDERQSFYDDQRRFATICRYRALYWLRQTLDIREWIDMKLNDRAMSICDAMVDIAPHQKRFWSYQRAHYQENVNPTVV